MAVTTVFQSSQGKIGKSQGGSPLANVWNVVRGTNTTSGTSVAASGQTLFGCSSEPARGGAFIVGNNRAYFYFDLSAITTTITAISFKVTGGSNSSLQNGDWIVARANQDSDFATATTSEYPMVFNSSTQFTSYSTNVNSWSSNAVNTVALNSTAITNANSVDEELCLCLMNYTYDYNDGEVEESFGNLTNTLNLATSGDQRAKLEVTHAAGGYGNEVNNIIPAKISKVLGIATADISKIIGV